MDEEPLNNVVHELLAQGRLPKSAASQVLASYGDGSPCAVCAKPLHAEAAMYGVRVSGERDAGVEPRVLHMHLACFTLWETAIAVARK